MEAVSSRRHIRFVTLVAQQGENEIVAELKPQTFKLASVDIDVLSHYSKAYAGKVS